MATKITMPQLGESVTEGTISKWLVQPGDYVNKYEPIAEVMTDKVNAEVPSSYTGTITELVAKEDETVQVGDLICMIEANEEKETTAPKQDAEQDTETQIRETYGDGEVTEEPMKKRYSPAVLKLSQEHGIDLSKIEGSGRGGRITRKDVEKVIAKGTQPSAAASEERQKVVTPPETERVETPTPQASAPKVEAGDVEVPVSGVRKAIAANMVKSKQEIPHAWTMVEVDVTNLMRYREKVKDEFKQKEGISLTPLPFFIKAVVEALKEFPQVNATWSGDRIIQKKDINISLAVATEDALFVPVIKDADDKSIKGLSKSIDHLASGARNGTLSNDEMNGGTFTVNNTGSFGSVQSMPIINHPQAAILSVESIVKRPVVMDDDMIGIRHMVNLCLSLDHRALDGLVCGRFLARIKEKLESFNPDQESIY